jgi:Bacterial Ig domain/Right handed beta helix region
MRKAAWRFAIIAAVGLGTSVQGRGTPLPQPNQVTVTTPQELQQAISEAAFTPGPDTIHLAAGVFHFDSSTFSPLFLFANDSAGPNGITLSGAGPSLTILEGGGPTFAYDIVTVDGSSPMTIENMTIENGGRDGIYNNGTLILRDSIVRNNGRAGIETVGDRLAVFGSTISGNGTGLGLFGEAGIYVESNLSVVNSTITGNSSTGIYVEATSDGAILTNVTIAGNIGSGIDVHAPITFTNTIIAGNASDDCKETSLGLASSVGPNLVGSGSCVVATGASPGLGALTDNGGPTPTMALAAGSPAIDAGDSGACPATDQRGIARPQGLGCDIGAFELEPAPVNGAPTCVPYGNTIFEATPLTHAVACSDPDAGDTFTVLKMSDPLNGTVTMQPDGTFTYVPNSGFAGTDVFTFRAKDSHDEFSSLATATITVVSHAPVCHGFTGLVGSGATLEVGSAVNVLCSDPDGDALTYSVVFRAAHGTVSISATGFGFLYSPDSTYLGVDSFTYQATDSHSVGSSFVTATIQVVNTPAGPNVTVRPDPSVSLRFGAVSNAGTTTATSSTTGPPTPAGFQIADDSLYWELSTTVTFSPPVEVCIVAPAGVTNPRLLHYDRGAWVDVTTRMNGGFVCGNVTSLSPFVVAVPVSAHSASNLAYTGSTTAVFGPVALSARLTNAATHAGLGGRSVTFSVDGGAPLAATTTAHGTATATTPLPLAPGSHTVDVRFAGDLSVSASSARATVVVSRWNLGSVDADGLRPVTGGRIDLKVDADWRGLKGHLLYDDGPRGRRPFEAKTMTAFGVASDGHSAWIAGVDKDGHTFLAHAVDNGHGRRGRDTFTLWIDGVLQTGDGALRAGDVCIDSER